MWIYRDIEESIQSNLDPIQIFRGPRQCGKSSLVLKLDPSFRELSLDDFRLRDLAQKDPEVFLRSFEGEKLFIDEAQYAPALFPALKRRVDLYKRSGAPRETIIRITCSNQILMDRNVKESLAGRVSYFDMNTLSVAEILKSQDLPIQEILYRGGWPELYAVQGKDPKKYLDDYVNSYIEKDIVLAAGVQKSAEFLKFVQLLAGRVGELFEFSHFAREVGVTGDSIKEWASLLERMYVIALVPPYSSNLSSRLVKSPKVYFIDTGLACRLQGWTSAAPMLTSPQQGHLFENLVFSEIYKTNINFQKGWRLFHWRSRGGEEVDFLLQKEPGQFLFIEAKVRATDPENLSSYPEVRKVFKGSPPPQVLCHQEGDAILGSKVPIAQLKNFLLRESR